MKKNDVLLEVENLRKYFPITRGIMKRVIGQVKAVDGISFQLRKGETLSLVGESGCGKSTTGRAILRLLEPTGGRISFKSQRLTSEYEDRASINVNNATPVEMKKLRRDMQIIFQDPYSSLNKKKTIGTLLREPFTIHKICSGSELEDRIAYLINAVGLDVDHLKRYPHQFSGGQRQRIGIARALALEPELIIADEPVSALDVSVQAQVLNLIMDLQSNLNLSYLFISHDLSVVKHVSDRIAVMYLGRIVELSENDELFENPKHPYTEFLMSAVPIPDPALSRERMLLAGEVPSAMNPPEGCHFHPRCPHSTEECRHNIPELYDVGDGHLCACHHADKLELRGIYE